MATQGRHWLLGPLLLSVAALSLSVSDTILKAVGQSLPPVESMALRAVFAVLWLPALFVVMRTKLRLTDLLQPRVLLRSGIELVATYGFVFSLVNMQIANLTAMLLTAPIYAVLGAALFLGEKVRPLSWVLVALGLVGALLVAQPGGAGFSPYALLAGATAVLVATRDLSGRKVPAHVPGPTVAAAMFLVLIPGTGIFTLLFEPVRMPEMAQFGLLALAGLTAVLGQMLIFLAYRAGAVAFVAPFYYSASIWSLIAGLVVFGQLPNTLALAGIALIVVAGIGVVTFGARGQKDTAPSVDV